MSNDGRNGSTAFGGPLPYDEEHAGTRPTGADRRAADGARGDRAGARPRTPGTPADPQAGAGARRPGRVGAQLLPAGPQGQLRAPGARRLRGGAGAARAVLQRPRPARATDGSSSRCPTGKGSTCWAPSSQARGFRTVRRRPARFTGRATPGRSRLGPMSGARGAHTRPPSVSRWRRRFVSAGVACGQIRGLTLEPNGKRSAHP
jgi:hypothetical protein